MSHRLADERAPDASTEDTPGTPARRWPGHLAVLLCYAALAYWVTSRLWIAPETRLLTDNRHDQPLMEWMFAHGAYALTHLSNPLLTDSVQVPHGANLMANSSVVLPALILAPVTLAFGAATSFVLFTGLCLAGTAAAWYVLFRRRLTGSALAAGLGAGLIGFAPGMISLSNAHVHITAQFLVPFVLACVLPSPGRPRPVRRGALLGLLLAAQLLTGTEVLLFTVLGVGVFVLLWTALTPSAVRRQLRGFAVRLGVAVGVFAVLAGYPLWVLLAGPNSYHGTPWDIGMYGTDVAAWPWFNAFSLLGGAAQAGRVYSGNATEQTAFLGPGLLVLVAALVWWLRRRRTVLALAATALLFAVFSFGTEIVVLRSHTGVAGPWALVARLPLIEQAIPDRLALVAVAAFGTILTLGADRAVRTGLPRPLWLAAYAAALLPILPTALPVTHRPPIPQFFTAGSWRDHVRAGHSVLAVPTSFATDRLSMRWSSGTNAEMAVPDGAVMIPGPDGEAQWGTPRSRLATTAARVSRTGRVPGVDDADRARARSDLAAGRTDCVVLDPAAPHGDAVRRTLDRLLSVRARYAGGVWYWDVRPAR